MQGGRDPNGASYKSAPVAGRYAKNVCRLALAVIQ